MNAAEVHFLARAMAFVPGGAMSDDELAAENISERRWWPLPDIVGYRRPDLFGPCDLATLLTELIAHGVPATPVPLGL